MRASLALLLAALALALALPAAADVVSFDRTVDCSFGYLDKLAVEDRAGGTVPERASAALALLALLGSGLARRVRHPHTAPDESA